MSHIDNERLVIAAHLHMLLRRKAGRITDTEWLAVNDDYATEIVRFARTLATGPEMEDITKLVDRLENLLVVAAMQHKVKKPALAPNSPSVPIITSTQGQYSSAPGTMWANSKLPSVETNGTPEESAGHVKRYRGGLR